MGWEEDIECATVRGWTEREIKSGMKKKIKLNKNFLKGKKAHMKETKSGSHFKVVFPGRWQQRDSSIE